MTIPMGSMWPATPTCKLCGFSASSNNVYEFGPELFEHIEAEHPEAWAELMTITPDRTQGQHRVPKEDD